jgi:D-sedoheptulose 7-phosphate isomerase
MNIRSIIQESAWLKEKLLEDQALIPNLEALIDRVVDCYRNGGKTLFCGNGGSAADAQHLAAEFTGRFYFDRPPLDAEALHVNTSYMTAVANDYSYDEVYARLVKARANAGDVLVALSTSGNSPNVVKALEAARMKSVSTVGFTGMKPSGMDEWCDFIFKVPTADTPRVQELHILLGHIICQGVEEKLFGQQNVI